MIRFEESVVHRLWLASGIASVLAIVVAFLLLPADEGGESPADIAARYADGREGYLRAAFVEVLSVALFLVFLAAFGAVLRRAEGEGVPFAAVAVVAGSVAAALQIVSYALIATLAYRTAETGNEDVIMAFYDFSSLASGFAAVPLAVFLAAASAGIIRARVAPAVFGYLGLAAAAFLAGGGCVTRARGRVLRPRGHRVPRACELLALAARDEYRACRACESAHRPPGRRSGVHVASHRGALSAGGDRGRGARGDRESGLRPHSLRTSVNPYTRGPADPARGSPSRFRRIAFNAWAAMLVAVFGVAFFGVTSLVVAGPVTDLGYGVLIGIL